MRNKNLVCRKAEKVIIMFLFLLCLTAGFFVFVSAASAEKSPIAINEVLVGTSDDTRNEFIELYNSSDAEIDLAGFKLKKKLNKTGSEESSLVSASKFSGKISAHGYFLITTPEYKDFYSADLVYSGKSYSITSDNTILLYDTDDILVDSLSYDGENKNSSYSLSGGAWFWSSVPTPGKENSQKPESKVYSKDIRINELLPNPSQTPEKENEFIELYNFGSEDIDLSDWHISDKTSSFKLFGIAKPGGFATFYNTVSLNNDGDEITLKNPLDETTDSIAYGPAKENTSYGFDGKDWKWTAKTTHGAENQFKKPFDPANQAVYLNEVLPHPAKGQEEYIELFNYGNADLDLEDWTLKDASKTGSYVFPESSIIKANDFLTIYKSDFKFALNDSGEEDISLLNPLTEIASNFYYSKSHEDVSWNFDGQKWRESRFLTPEKENKFNNLPSVTTKEDKKIYKNMYVDFSAQGSDKDKDKLKYSWDFGDGHKSFLQKTRHKYAKAGQYTVKLKVFDGSEEKIETFKIEVGKYPESDVKIVSLSPNPKGKDSDLEWIIVRNDSKKKVNLNGWSIATGSKNLYNHPITEDLMIKPGKELKITRDFSKFTLNNKATKVELRYPNGKVASKMKYESEKSIEEDAVYKKTASGWQWQIPKTMAAENVAETMAPEIEIPPVEQISQTEIDANIGKYSQSDYWKMKQAQKIVLLSYNSQIKTPVSLLEPHGRVLGDFSENQPDKKYWLIKLLENITTKINILLNKFIFAIL